MAHNFSSDMGRPLPRVHRQEVTLLSVADGDEVQLCLLADPSVARVHLRVNGRPYMLTADVQRRLEMSEQYSRFLECDLREVLLVLDNVSLTEQEAVRALRAIASIQRAQASQDMMGTVRTGSAKVVG